MKQTASPVLHRVIERAERDCSGSKPLCHRPPLTAERLRERLSYCPETGVFRWLGARQNKGSITGGLHNGYCRIKIDGRKYYAHRLVWLYVHGCWPRGDIDHRNGVRDDNRLANLREATESENSRNAKRRSNNTSGFKGANWCSREAKWRAQIDVGRRKINLGYHDTPEAAHAAYRAAAKKHFGAFARFE